MGTDNITFIGAFVAGMLSFLSPCVLPLIPSYITYLTGLSFADLQAEHPTHKVRQQTIIHSLIFVAGFTTVFVLLGASATFIGNYLQAHMGFMRKIGGVLIIIFGIHVSGIFDIGILLGEKRLNVRRKPAGYLGSFVVGVAFAAGWTPCIGPILASILMVAATEKTVFHGIVLLLVYSLGLGLPFFLAALAMHQFMVFFNRFKKYIRIFEIITGVFLIIVGVLIFTNYLAVLARYANMLFMSGD
jgi:cytochrome c-type biogenesis protein